VAFRSKDWQADNPETIQHCTVLCKQSIEATHEQPLICDV
jgi:hypothetical protein